MPSLSSRVKWVINPNIFAFEDMLFEALITIVQGYLEDDYAKFKSGALILNTVKSLDKGRVLIDDFVNTISDVYELYGITDEQHDEIIKRVNDADASFQLESKLVFKSHESFMAKKEEHDGNKT